MILASEVCKSSVKNPQSKGDMRTLECHKYADLVASRLIPLDAKKSLEATYSNSVLLCIKLGKTRNTSYACPHAANALFSLVLNGHENSRFALALTCIERLLQKG